MINKKQHFVPAVYLKYFTKERSRDGTLYVHNGNTGQCRRSSPDKECTDRLFYGKMDTAEDVFANTFESRYPEIADRILSGKRLDERGNFFLFLFMVHLHARNPSFLSNVPQVNRKDKFELVFDNYLQRLIELKSNKIVSVEWARKCFIRDWDLQFIPTRTCKILTTDNPCSIISYHNEEEIIVFMPISCEMVALAARRKYLRFSNTFLNQHDIKFLQASIYGQRNLWSFCDFEIKELNGDIKHIMDSSLRPSVVDDLITFTPCIYTQDISCLRWVKKPTRPPSAL